jgi:hypothetical protein
MVRSFEWSFANAIMSLLQAGELGSTRRTLQCPVPPGGICDCRLKFFIEARDNALHLMLGESFRILSKTQLENAVEGSQLLGSKAFWQGLPISVREGLTAHRKGNLH